MGLLESGLLYLPLICRDFKSSLSNEDKIQKS